MGPRRRERDAMSWFRSDAAAGPVTKGKGKTADGKGYNPYRAAGKFATGPHKEKEKVGRGKAAPAEGAVGKPKRGAAAVGDKKPAANEKTKRVQGAKAAVEKAKADPSPENIKAARGAVTEARTHGTEHQAPHESGHAAPAPQHAPVAARPMTDGDLDVARQKFAASTTPEEFQGVGNYRGMYFSHVNQSLREGGYPRGDKELVDDTVKQLDSALGKSRLDRDTILYRGVSEHPAVASLKQGDVFVDKAFMSTSTSHDPGTVMGGEYLFHITAPKGTKAGAIVADESGFTGAWGGEKEVLLGRSTAMRLDRVEKVTQKDDFDGSSYEQTVMHFTVVGQM